MHIIPPRRRTKEWWEDDEQRQRAAAVAQKLGLSRRDLIRFMAASSTAAGAAMLLDACGGSADKTDESKEAPAAGQQGQPGAAGGMPADAAPADKQVFRGSAETNPGTLEYNGSYYGGGISSLFAPLQAYDQNLKVINYACESAEKNPDGTIWTYKLRPEPSGPTASRSPPRTGSTASSTPSSRSGPRTAPPLSTTRSRGRRSTTRAKGRRTRSACGRWTSTRSRSSSSAPSAPGR